MANTTRTSNAPKPTIPQMGALGDAMAGMLEGKPAADMDLDMDLDMDPLESPEAGRLAAMSAGLAEDHDDVKAPIPAASGDTIEDMLTRDFSSVAARDLPELPEGYAFQMVLEDDEYKRRVVDLRVLVEDTRVIVRETFKDALYVDESALHRGVMADMDCRWVNPTTNEPDFRASIDGGFVPVKMDIDSRYRYDKEKKRVVNGDLQLYMRPKDVSLARAIELAQRNGGAIGSSMQQVIDETPRGAEIVESKLKLSQSNDEAGSQGANSRYTRNGDNIQNVADQMAERGKAQRSGRGATISVAAPWQKTIIGGRVISDPSQILGAVGGR